MGGALPIPHLLLYVPLHRFFLLLLVLSLAVDATGGGGGVCQSHCAELVGEKRSA